MYDIEKGIDAQKRYCSKLGQPYFAPRDGACPNCHHNIYSEVKRTVKALSRITYQYTGISVENAGKFLITECPHCNKSFCN